MKLWKRAFLRDEWEWAESSLFGNFVLCFAPRWKAKKKTMRIVGRNKLDEFVQAHADARGWIETWLAEVHKVMWQTSQEIKARYAAASFLSDNVVIFNVKGNQYRLETSVAYKTSVVVIVWIGTHAEYDKRNKRR